MLFLIKLQVDANFFYVHKMLWYSALKINITKLNCIHFIYFDNWILLNLYFKHIIVII